MRSLTTLTATLLWFLFPSGSFGENSQTLGDTYFECSPLENSESTKECLIKNSVLTESCKPPWFGFICKPESTKKLFELNSNCDLEHMSEDQYKSISLTFPLKDLKDRPPCKVGNYEFQAALGASSYIPVELAKPGKGRQVGSSDSRNPSWS